MSISWWDRRKRCPKLASTPWFIQIWMSMRDRWQVMQSCSRILVALCPLKTALFAILKRKEVWKVITPCSIRSNLTNISLKQNELLIYLSLPRTIHLPKLKTNHNLIQNITETRKAMILTLEKGRIEVLTGLSPVRIVSWSQPSGIQRQIWF